MNSSCTSLLNHFENSNNYMFANFDCQQKRVKNIRENKDQHRNDICEKFFHLAEDRNPLLQLLHCTQNLIRFHTSFVKHCRTLSGKLPNKNSWFQCAFPTPSQTRTSYPPYQDLPSQQWIQEEAKTFRHIIWERPVPSCWREQIIPSFGLFSNVVLLSNNQIIFSCHPTCLFLIVHLDLKFFLKV